MRKRLLNPARELKQDNYPGCLKEWIQNHEKQMPFPHFLSAYCRKQQLTSMDQVITLLLGRKTPSIQILESMQESEITDLWLPLEKLTSQAEPRKVNSRPTGHARAAGRHWFGEGLWKQSHWALQNSGLSGLAESLPGLDNDLLSMKLSQVHCSNTSKKLCEREKALLSLCPSFFPKIWEHHCSDQKRKTYFLM